MRGGREGGVSSVDRVAMNKNKRKLEKVLKVQQRRHNEEQRKMDSESSFLVEQSQDCESSLSSDADEEDSDFGLPETSKQIKQIQKRQPVVNLVLDPTQWSETVSLVIDKHGIRNRGLTEIMSAVVSSGGSNINDLLSSKTQCVDIAIEYESKLRGQYLRKTWKQFNHLNS